MTIDEAIKIYEMGAKRTWNGRLTIYAEQCQQMAEWLKELKRHREAWEKVKSEVDQHTEIHSDGEFYIKNFDVKKIIAEYRPKEGDAE